ncbi:hypothetical protein F511_12724 [Dorcoceras hygrometricum]|uniref:FCP1 homology domain-containing protein n=1 Tax=Dorcoceras hygrometricum TaxID=472368 RepID=A0A2Z7DBL2_9LAMI|nr:hypothetical protein F511_12724 [Dorcoceras hygrometricum]
MPSLRMKTKSTTGSLTENNSLHICRKSCVISKNPLSHARVSQNVEEVGTYIQNSFHGPETNHDEFFDVEHFLQKQQFNETDSLAADNLDTKTPLSTSNVDTIFSSILESLDFHSDEGIDHLYVPQLDSKESGDASSRNQCESQACNASELYDSEINFPGPHVECNSVYDDKTHTISWLDYKCKESSLLPDVAEDYRILPVLEETFDAGRNHDSTTSGEAILDAENSNLSNVIHQLRPCDLEADIDTCHDPDHECFDPQLYIRNIPGQLDESLCNSSVTKDTRRITLVLDLDETLVHSTLDYCDDADFTFTVFFNMKEHTVYVKKRPHLNVFLERVAELFDIMVFTASQSIYAKQLLDILDPEGKLLSKRAYRESCIILEGIYVKDLTVLGVDLAKVAIIDNSPQVFKLQVNNGIPIRSWFDDPADCALISLLPFLETLVDVDDVRPIIARKFGNKE